MQRPGMQRLMADIAAGKLDIILAYKIDRLTRSLADFAKVVEVLDKAGASFVSITQSFNSVPRRHVCPGALWVIKAENLVSFAERKHLAARFWWGANFGGPGTFLPVGAMTKIARFADTDHSARIAPWCRCAVRSFALRFAELCAFSAAQAAMTIRSTPCIARHRPAA